MQKMGHQKSFHQAEKFILSIIIFMVLSGCSKKIEPDDNIQVVVSILPLAEFTEKIGGGRVHVSVMVPAGTTPHNYEPTPSQLIGLNTADIYVKVGTPIEFEIAWLDKILAANKNMLVCDASKDIPLSEKDLDPHVWLSPVNAKIMVGNIYAALIEKDAEHKEFYRMNKTKYIEELAALDKQIKTMLAQKKNRKFMVYHPAWGYFARSYDLEQIAVEKQGKEPTAKGILQVIEQAQKENINIIFASPQFNTKNAQVIAREIKGEVLLIDPLAKNYIDNLKNIALQLAQTREQD
jgi:zinc transport system substrate-binding protein